MQQHIQANILTASVMNPYDARRTCDREENGPRCYKQIGWIEKYMNNPMVKAAIGAAPQLQFSLCNSDVEHGFLARGDFIEDIPALLPELVNDGVRLLIYAGVAGEFYAYQSDNL